MGSGFSAVFSAIHSGFRPLPARPFFLRRPRRSKRMTTRWPATRYEMRVVVNFDQEPEPRWFMLRSPNRLVIDLLEDEIRHRSQGVEGEGLINQCPLRAHQRQDVPPDHRGQGRSPSTRSTYCRTRIRPATARWRTSRRPRSAPSTRRWRCRRRQPARPRRRRKASAWD